MCLHTAHVVDFNLYSAELPSASTENKSIVNIISSVTRPETTTREPYHFTMMIVRESSQVNEVNKLI